MSREYESLSPHMDRWQKGSAKTPLSENEIAQRLNESPRYVENVQRHAPLSDEILSSLIAKSELQELYSAEILHAKSKPLVLEGESVTEKALGLINAIKASMDHMSSNGGNLVSILVHKNSAEESDDSSMQAVRYSLEAFNSLPGVSAHRTNGDSDYDQIIVMWQN